MKATNRIYDLFVSYNSADLEMVEYIVSKLRVYGLHPWFDKWSVQKGREFQRQLEDGLSNSRSIVVFIGISGIGPWAEMEFRAGLNKAVKNGDYPVIPVFLPGAKKIFDSLPLFLRNMSYVDFGDDFKAPNKIIELARGIAGTRSEEFGDTEFSVALANRPFELSHLSALTTRTIRAYDAIAEKFTEQWFGHPPLEILELLNETLGRPSKILDAGCGPGHHAQFLKKNGHEVVGIDLSREMLRIAESKTLGIAYKCMDMRSMDFPRGSFDCVWSAASTIHVPREGLTSQLFEFRKVLKPSGLLGLNLQIERKSEIAADGRFFEFYESREEIKNLLDYVGFNIVAENYGETMRNTHELDLTLKWVTLYCRLAE